MGYAALRSSEAGEDRSADHFGDLRHYGVSELLSSVHPIGNPIFHSTNSGTGLIPRTGSPSIEVVTQSFRCFPNVGFV
jgi:hypothetical protein